MNILLTGATGFLGSHLLTALLRKGFRVTILKRSFSNINKIRSLMNDLNYYDIDRVSLFDIFKANSFNAVIHTATNYGHDGSELWSSNIDFPMQLVNICLENHVPVFINTDTYFAKSQRAELQYLNEYTRSKIMLGKELRRVANTSPLQIINMRLEHIFGEGDSNFKFTNNLINQLLQGNSIELTLGEQKRDFIYIEDAVQAYLTVLKFRSFLPAIPYLDVEVGRGESMTIWEFVETAAKVTQSTSELQFGKLPYRQGEIMDSVASLQLLSRINWEPRWTVQQGIERMVKHYKTN